MEKFTLYTQPGCPQCKMIHKMMDDKGFDYNECQDIDKMKELAINHTPALEVDGTILQGKALIDFIKTRG